MTPEIFYLKPHRKSDSTCFFQWEKQEKTAKLLDGQIKACYIKHLYGLFRHGAGVNGSSAYK